MPKLGPSLAISVESTAVSIATCNYFGPISKTDFEKTNVQFGSVGTP
jgi:hypothetical protein